ncbi:hypothetical protein HAZT_HAZT009456 [Hyalella azteca]|uniref:Methyltransferase-like protein 17, mitochondrial n=1 Tax=Hyalella azteca TaxID=294128 RepID=A0A6A0H3X6_HYAAZ|nr:hypothetical protein HAZT_HAZT009456 [Hyalella azteca]
MSCVVLSALLYMMARLTPDFAALMKVFHQLRCALPTFMPTTMLDFGSGVGSATWAVDQTWPKSCKEVVNVDPSNAMHELHDVLLRGGLASLPLPRRKNSTSFRHFLPLTGSLKHDLVVCSRTLFEIGSRDMRLRTLDILWKTVMPGGCLVLVEGGRASGCHLTLEARDFLMQGLKVDTSSSRLRGRIIAPCPHQNACPLLAKQPKYRICTDSQLYQEVEYPDPLLEVFSYLIVQKPKELETREDTLITWPRIIQPVIKSDSVIVRVCNKFGHLQELCASKGKHGTLCRQVARKSTLGDLYPVELLPPSQHINPGYNAIDLCHNKKARDDDKF